MNPEFEKIQEKPEHSFIAKMIERDSRPLLSQAWHFHPEIEICFTKKSRGKRFVGNQIDDYEECDLVMFGTNLPHGFITDTFCQQVVIQFNIDFLGHQFMDAPELRIVKNLLIQSKRGLIFHGETKKKAQTFINKIMSSSGLERTIHLLFLLLQLAESPERKAICSPEYSFQLDETHLDRIKIVYDHIIDNYKNPVEVKKVAEKLNLSESAFYKFIKKHTKKTYTEIINEFRINHASKQLISTDHTISQICFANGFNNVSYFNRKFKSIIGKTPAEFRKKYTYQQK